MVRVVPQGGTKPYTYLWNDVAAQTDSIAENLPGSIAGISYKVILTDSNGCVDSTTSIITQPQELDVIGIDTGNVSCFGGNDGFVSVLAIGGTAPFSFIWNDPLNQNDSLAQNLEAGNYKVIVTDNNNCIDSITVPITEPIAAISGGFSDTT